MMREAVEHGRCHLGIAKHAGPFAEAQIGGDGDGGLLVQLAQQMEQQRPARNVSRIGEAVRLVLAIIKPCKLEGAFAPLSVLWVISV
jgi:hypothetical protein